MIRLRQSLCVALLVIAMPVLAETPQEKGLRIAQEADARNSGWQASSAEMTMLLRNAEGEESLRQLRIKSLEMPEDGDKSLMVFEEPKDVRGTALLTYSHKVGPDDQWLYLPVLKRVKRIASRNKSGPFVGSEFAFEDLSSQEVEKYTYQYLRDESCGERTCFVVRRFPKDEYSGYTSQLTWIDQQDYQLRKVEFYDRKKSLLKTLSFEGYQLYEDQFWRPSVMAMQNHQTKRATDLNWTNFDFKIELNEGDFSKNALKRAR